MSNQLNSNLKYELSKYLTNEELNRLERTENFFKKINYKKEELILINKNKNIPIKYLELIMQGTIIPEERIIKMLEDYAKNYEV
ncbi:hypothetical protein [Enterococcus casseliflavus]|uniref:hypothetical protein n=1 Tax=Enterococcus casseliflavus TaxID=37734 RepID=UPI003D6C26EC